ncbi:PHP domain-containing protein [Thomasclavelia spiroformis]|uniref:PHP domain-containing protein n=1 Tax=Thomasclavelia spiroformis TaxID=29348 RepID=A0A1Y4QGE6_9FIRM|nr:PHP domain-containing protein [Thomasclavelia spiroformis]OUQ04210.1 PHP domain-containing protein [Thomasclavelia spiroformis]
MYYDLHIHSALSPCSNDLMTINNIFNMAYIKGLQLIAITDHNSLKQQYYLEKIIEHDILKGKIDYVHGVELQSSEEIHLLAYFKKGSNLNVIQEWIDKHLIKVKNQSDYYGNQYIFNEFDEVIGIEDNLLISSLDLNVYQIVKKVHEFNGVVILAHVMAKRYGIYEVYHGIPDDLNYDGIEVESIKQLNELKQLCKHLKDDYVFFNSDAHNLESISEPINQIDRDIFYQLWRK